MDIFAHGDHASLNQAEAVQHFFSGWHIAMSIVLIVLVGLAIRALQTHLQSNKSTDQKDK